MGTTSGKSRTGYNGGVEIVRQHANPVLPNVRDTWMHDQTANPDLLKVQNRWHLYFRGQSGGHDRIGLATVDTGEFTGTQWNIHPDPVIDVGGVGDWDETHVLDPATVKIDGTIFLYYSAVSPRCSRSVCLATSDDGIHFSKFQKNPVVIGGGPEIVYRDGIFHLYYWGESSSSDGFELFGATSENGYEFDQSAEVSVLRTSEPGSWDSYTVETPRIFVDRGVYYMIYCGSDRYRDYPGAAGLAVSTDLVRWTKYPDNPIFMRGEAGEWDEGAIWFATVEKIGKRYFVWYEGYGGGTARHEPYGSYLVEGRSQIGLATLDAPYFFVDPDNFSMGSGATDPALTTGRA
jgi:predicted GH43/DUF377 family glycosyl hydrolase